MRFTNPQCESPSIAASARNIGKAIRIRRMGGNRSGIEGLAAWSGFGHISTYRSRLCRSEKRAKAVKMKRIRRFDAYRKSLSSARVRTYFVYKAQTEDPYHARGIGWTYGASGLVSQRAFRQRNERPNPESRHK